MRCSWRIYVFSCASSDRASQFVPTLQTSPDAYGPLGLNCILDLLSSDLICDKCQLMVAAGVEDFSPPVISAWDARDRMVTARKRFSVL